MGLFMPADVAERITRFMAGDLTFPYVKREEMIGAFFIYGKDYGVQGEAEVKESRDLARRTVEQFARDVHTYQSMPSRLDPEFTRENYTKRMLQLAVDSMQMQQQDEIGRRLAGDPMVLTDCFAQHVAHYRQEFRFEIFGPFKREQLPFLQRKKLEGRMLLLGYNAKTLPFKSPLEPFLAWLPLSSKV
jgi:hypothetical protein